METMSLAWGYLFFILALQTVRRRSAAILPHVLVSAAFPLASLVYDLNVLPVRREEIFAAGFIGVMVIQLLLIYLANRFWAVEHSLRHDNAIPAGIGPRERLKLLLAGIVLFAAHNQYPQSATLYAMLDRAMFWAVTALVALSVLHAFATVRHPVPPQH